ncbi:uncharacterized protein LOC128883444 isoform X2 [Hylaeus volcanicus]|uniref:uncharacterized protein LOC128883444 isoform X2 n=1 Tax=Hylaeus volcanicus TaxID=313075 RepID=UPI0023B8320A|nr:uncharacterized protein LOC128883444 isoform X2 [Hylaeus volcanicus]
MASCHESGHNISFTSVGLLWTLAESLIRRYTLLKENTNAQPSFLPILPNHAYRALNFSLATQQFHIPLGLHSPLEEQEQLSRTVIIIFHLFKYHALDSRIEVRNCALKSLLVAYEEILQKSSNHHAIFKHCVSQIILHVLKDCVSTYKLLMEHEPFFEKQMPANDGSLHHHSRDSQIKLWNETFTILFDAVTRLIHYCISCVSSETFFDESHKFLKNTCDTAIKFPKYILLNCAENPSTSPQVIAACLSFVVVVITKSIECNFLSFSLLEPYWVLFEKFITALWSFSVIPNQIVDHLIGAVTKLCLNVLPFFFKKNVERCTRLLAACVSSIHYAVHIAQMPELNFSKDHPYRSEQHVESIFPSLKLCEKIILSGAFFFNKYDTYFFKHILTVMKSDQLLEFLRTTFSYPDDVKTGDSLDKCFKNSCFFNQNIFKNLVFQSNDFNPSTLPDPPIRTNYSYSSIPADFCTPIRKTELSESPFEEKISIQSMHGNEETLEGNNTENVMPLEFFSTCTSLKLKHESLDDETYNYTLEYKKLCRNDQNNPFDDDYVSLPSWLIPELCISLKDHPELSKQFCQIIKIKRRLRVARKKILTIDSYFELLEGHFPWEQLLILSPYLWLTVLKKSFSYFFSCERLLGNPNFLVKTFRFINSVTRIQRRCYFHISTLKTNSDDVFFGLVILTYKLCTQLISLIIFLRGFHALSHQSYVYEAVIQTFLDLKVFLDYVFQDTRNFPSNLLDLLEVLSIPLMALLDTWLSFQKIISPSSSSPQNFLNNNISDLFPFLAKILLIKQENISVSKYSPYNQNVPVLGLAVLFHIAKAYGNHGMLPLNASLEKDSTNQHVDNYTLVQRQYYIIIVCLINRIRTLFDDYVKEENDSGQCPVPRYRLEQVCLALVKIRELDPLLHTINVFKLKDNERTLALTHFFFVKSLGSSVPQPFKQTFVLELFPDLIPLISSKDKAVRHHVIQLMQCLVPHFLKFPTD